MLNTPYYLIDEEQLLVNLQKIELLRQRAGVKVLLALKCFASWSLFDLMRPFMDGSTSSSLYELKLGRQKFGGETHAYSVAWAENEIDEAVENCDKIIFNSISQLKRFDTATAGVARGLRVNPQLSRSAFILADPARPFSRLGESDIDRIAGVMGMISGFMFHFNCDNTSFESFDGMLTDIEHRFGTLLDRMKWVSLGGGIHFTGEGYPLKRFADRLKEFASCHDVQLYLEPGEATITQSGSLEVTVLDTLFNGKHLAIIDASIEAHMPDLLTYRLEAKMKTKNGPFQVMVCGKSCLAGDIFGEYPFDQLPVVGDRLSLLDAAGYTMVKKNWFNGLKMPSIVIRRNNGRLDLIREFSFDDYVQSLS